jgi:hypothetical protein
MLPVHVVHLGGRVMMVHGTKAVVRSHRLSLVVMLTTSIAVLMRTWRLLLAIVGGTRSIHHTGDMLLGAALVSHDFNWSISEG